MKLLCLVFVVFFINFLALSSGFGVESLWSWTNQMIDGPEKVLQNVTIVFTWAIDENIFSETFYMTRFRRPDTYSAVFLPLKGIHLLPNHKRFDRNKDTVIYFHGWLESGKLDLSALGIRGAYLDRGDHNVISVDWSFYSKNFNYPTRVIPQMKIVSSEISQNATKWHSLITKLIQDRWSLRWAAQLASRVLVSNQPGSHCRSFPWRTNGW